MNWEAIVGFSSAVIALCAFGLTIWQACITRRHNKLSVTPHLTTWTHSDKAKNIYAVELLNNGIGPALIISFHIQVDGQAIIGEGTEPMEKALRILFPQYQYSSWQSFVSKGYMMSAKEARNLVTIQFHGEKLPRPEEVEHATKRARLLIEYKSIYQDKSTLDTLAFRDLTLQGTPASGHP
ncbi:MAG: hypothetical protein HQ551_13270 [Desulfobacteraceae bacterium]|nr:hypothetical protein [Desulfobacteraceae bacterium]